MRLHGQLNKHWGGTFHSQMKEFHRGSRVFCFFFLPGCQKYVIARSLVKNNALKTFWQWKNRLYSSKWHVFLHVTKSWFMFVKVFYNCEILWVSLCTFSADIMGTERRGNRKDGYYSREALWFHCGSCISVGKQANIGAWTRLAETLLVSFHFTVIQTVSLLNLTACDCLVIMWDWKK